jgi:DNA-directed RNA polymerase subunit beta'
MLVDANEMVDLNIIDKIMVSNVFQVKVRSILTCAAETGICAKCYGLNLASNKPAIMGDVVGIMAAQSIGEPGTQLTLRTFHIGGTASRIVEQSEMRSRKPGKIVYNDLMNIVLVTDENGESYFVSTVRNGKIELQDKDGRALSNYMIPYGAKVFVKDNEKIKPNQVLFSWDPYTDVILSRADGLVRFRDMIENETFVEEAVEGGKKMMVITESRNRNLNPHIEIESLTDSTKGSGMSVLPVKATIIVKDGQEVKEGEVIVKISREAGKTRDITGGLPRIAELFEARKPSNPAVIAEIDGHIKFGKIRRGIREIIVKSATGEEKSYKIPYGKHIIVHDDDFVVAGNRLCEGAVSPQDILAIRGASKVQEYLVDQIQEVYRLQGVSINDKHIEVIVRQMMQKVEIQDPGNADYLPGDRINRFAVLKTNQEIMDKSIIQTIGNSDYEVGDLVTNQNIDDINEELAEQGKELIEAEPAQAATFKPLLLGITRASLNTDSFISAASFQETTRVLTDAAVQGKTDYLRGLKENVIIGRLIPAGTGASDNLNIETRKKESETPDAEIANPEESISQLI